VEQVVDELPPRRFVAPHREQLRPLVALGQRVDRLLGGGQHALGRRPHLTDLARLARAGFGTPGGPGGGQVAAHQLTQPHALARGPLPQLPPRPQLVPRQAPAGRRHLGENPAEAVQTQVELPVRRLLVRPLAARRRLERHAHAARLLDSDRATVRGTALLGCL
jgi:hypothetical protein